MNPSQVGRDASAGQRDAVGTPAGRHPIVAASGVGSEPLPTGATEPL
jgi:hypothetical protein